MKLKFTLLLLLGLLLLVGVKNSSANQKARPRPVPKNFSYPEASEIVEIEALAKSLSGIVGSANGDGLPDALVERVDSNWENRLAATFTDSQGRFNLSKVPDGTYYLKVSMSGFSTLRVKVILKKRAKSRLELELPPGI
jgi:hypothetical protein